MIRPNGTIDRSAVMTDAHKQLRLMRAHGWSWSRCLSFSWAKARQMREAAQLPLAA